MNWLPKLRLRFRALFQKEKLDARMGDEMRAHIELQTQENTEAGMKPEEARYAAETVRWVEAIDDACREQRGVSWIQNLGQTSVRVLGCCAKAQASRREIKKWCQNNSPEMI